MTTTATRTRAEIERDIAGKRAELASWVLRENREKANDELNALLDEWTQAKQ